MDPTTAIVVTQAMTHTLMHELVKDFFRWPIDKLYTAVGIRKKEVALEAHLYPIKQQLGRIETAVLGLENRMDRERLLQLSSGFTQLIAALEMSGGREGILGNAFAEFSKVINLGDGKTADYPHNELRALAQLGIAAVQTEWGNNKLAMEAMATACVESRKVTEGFVPDEMIKAVNAVKMKGLCRLTFKTHAEESKIYTNGTFKIKELVEGKGRSMKRGDMMEPLVKMLTDAWLASHDRLAQAGQITLQAEFRTYEKRLIHDYDTNLLKMIGALAIAAGTGEVPREDVTYLSDSFQLNAQEGREYVLKVTAYNRGTVGALNTKVDKDDRGVDIALVETKSDYQLQW